MAEHPHPVPTHRGGYTGRFDPRSDLLPDGLLGQVSGHDVVFQSQPVEHAGHFRHRAGLAVRQPLAGHPTAVAHAVQVIVVDRRGGLQVQHDHRHAEPGRPFGKLQLCRNRIHRINDVIILRKVNGIGILRQIKAAVCANLGRRVNGGDPLFHHFYLRFAHSVQRSNDLAVQIGKADGIMIEQVKPSDAAAGKRLRSKTANTADAENCNGGTLQFFNALRRQQKLGTGKRIHFKFPFCGCFPNGQTAAQIPQTAPRPICR